MCLLLETKIYFLLQVLLPLGELFDLYTFSGSLFNVVRKSINDSIGLSNSLA